MLAWRGTLLLALLPSHSIYLRHDSGAHDVTDVGTNPTGECIGNDPADVLCLLACRRIAQKRPSACCNCSSGLHRLSEQADLRRDVIVITHQVALTRRRSVAQTVRPCPAQITQIPMVNIRPVSDEKQNFSVEAGAVVADRRHERNERPRILRFHGDRRVTHTIEVGPIACAITDPDQRRETSYRKLPNRAHE